MAVFRHQFHPMVSAVARSRVSNLVAHRLEQEIDHQLDELSYEQLVHIQQDQRGNIVALTSNMGEINRLRSEIVDSLSTSLEQLRISDIASPVGILRGGRLYGPSIRIRAISSGNISAEFQSQFISAGVNQTLHRIWLDVSASMMLLLPSGAVAIPVNSHLCIAETILVGRVPELYFQIGGEN